MMYDNNSDDRERRSTHYYSYGPYQSRTERPEDAEMIVPQAVRAIDVKATGKQPGGWLTSRFAMFLLGALVIGGLMFAADKANLFSGDEISLQSGEDAAVMYTAGANNQQSANSAGGNGSSGGIGSGSAGVVRPGNIADIVDRTSNAVVKIETTVKTSSGLGGSLFDDPFFDRFFGDSFGDNGNNGGEQNGGMGSGFIFDKAGYILTNEHVIEGADKIYVKLTGSDKKYPAKLLGTAYDLDLAVLKIEGTKDFPTIKLGSSEEARVGDWVVAIGNPYGFEHTVTVGVLSAKERPISIPDTNGQRDYKNLLQTDASINPGNSGGPLLNLKGEVIGINTAVSAQAQGIGFAIPTSTINNVLDSLKANKKIVRAYMGVRLQDINKSWVSNLGLSGTQGSIIVQVENGSPADLAGLEPYDVVLSFNGKAVKNTQELQTSVQAQKPGDRVRLVIVRDGKKWTASVKLGKMDVGLSK